MKKNANPYYIVQKDETIQQIASVCNVHPISLLITNGILPKDIKKGIVLKIY